MAVPSTHRACHDVQVVRTVAGLVLAQDTGLDIIQDLAEDQNVAMFMEKTKTGVDH